MNMIRYGSFTVGKVTKPGQFISFQKKVAPEPVVYLTSNQSWQGASGSVLGADFVAPTGWGLGFWPPDEAIAVNTGDYISIDFSVNSNRGYFTQDLDTTGYIGQWINLSVYMDSGGASNRLLQVGGVSDSSDSGSPKIGRNWAKGIITGNSVSIRVGAGVTSNANGNFRLSRVQATIGEDARAYNNDI